MNTSKQILLTLITLFCLTSANAQYKANIKTNVLSLLMTIPQGSVEVGLSKQSSITLSAFKGTYTFLAESRVRGANLLYRFYFNDRVNNLTGFYAEGGAILNGEYLGFEQRWNDSFGGRVGFGWQSGYKRLVFDIGAAMAATQEKFNLYDGNGQVIGQDTSIEPFGRLNASIGFRF